VPVANEVQFVTEGTGVSGEGMKKECAVVSDGTSSEACVFSDRHQSNRATWRQQWAWRRLAEVALARPEMSVW
jgi:hypothetical protein